MVPPCNYALKVSCSLELGHARSAMCSVIEKTGWCLFLLLKIPNWVFVICKDKEDEQRQKRMWHSHHGSPVSVFIRSKYKPVRPKYSGAENPWEQLKNGPRLGTSRSSLKQWGKTLAESVSFAERTWAVCCTLVHADLSSAATLGFKTAHTRPSSA